MEVFQCVRIVYYFYRLLIIRTTSRIDHQILRTVSLLERSNDLMG